MGEIERAMWQAVRGYPGGAEAVAAVYGWNSQSFRNALNPNCPHRLNIEHLEGTFLSTRDKRIIDAVGHELGCLMLPVAVVGGIASDQAVLDNALELIEKTAGMLSEVRTSLDDGRIDPVEWERLNAAAIEVQRALAAVLIRCDQLRAE